MGDFFAFIKCLNLVNLQHDRNRLQIDRKLVHRKI